MIDEARRIVLLKGGPVHRYRFLVRVAESKIRFPFSGTYIQDKRWPCVFRFVEQGKDENPDQDYG